MPWLFRADLWLFIRKFRKHNDSQFEWLDLWLFIRKFRAHNDSQLELLDKKIYAPSEV